MPKKGTTVTDIEPIQKHEQSIAAKGVCKLSYKPLSTIDALHIYYINWYLIPTILAILKKGEGLGGKAVSLNKPKDKPAPQKPRAGAFN